MMEIKATEDGFEIEVWLNDPRTRRKAGYVIHVFLETGVTIPHIEEVDYHDLQRISKALQIATDLLSGRIMIRGGQ